MSQPESRTPPADDVTVLSRKTEIIGGTLKVAHDLTVRGVLEGEVRVGGKVVVAAGASIVGKLHAREAIIAGSVRGELTVSETLTLRSTAVVDGAAHASRLVVEEGSSGTVSLRVGDQSFFNLLDSRREEARAELDRVRSRRGAQGADRGDRGERAAQATAADSGGTSTDVAVTESDNERRAGKSSDDLMQAEEMGEFLSRESGEARGASRSIEDPARTAD